MELLKGFLFMSRGRYNSTNTMRIDIRRSVAPSPSVSWRQTDRTQTDLMAQFQAEEGLFLELLESVYDAVLITELGGRIVKTNGRAKDFFKYDRYEFFRCSILDIISGADTLLLPTTQEYLRNQRHVFIEAYCMCKDGTFFPAEITVNTIHMMDEECLCFFIRNVTVRKEMEEDLQRAQEGLVDAAHSAGMAEIATGVLHDVGNILNSVNVSADLLIAQLKESPAKPLGQVCALLDEKADDIENFLTNDPKGQKVPLLLSKVHARLAASEEEMTREADNLMSKIKMIKDVISTQQSYAKAGLHMEETALPEILDDALAIQKSAMDKLNVSVEKKYEPVATVLVQKTKMVHVLTNLIKNSVDAMAGNQDRPRELVLRIGHIDSDVFIKIRDTGCGIEPENLKKIFTHGFTTKADGHGFGLHTCANFISEMGGSITANSKGRGTGSSFIISLPANSNQAPQEQL
jgi:PAS domain S-box-containing protein